MQPARIFPPKKLGFENQRVSRPNQKICHLNFSKTFVLQHMDFVLGGQDNYFEASPLEAGKLKLSAESIFGVLSKILVEIVRFELTLIVVSLSFKLLTGLCLTLNTCKRENFDQTSVIYLPSIVFHQR